MPIGSGSRSFFWALQSTHPTEAKKMAIIDLWGYTLSRIELDATPRRLIGARTGGGWIAARVSAAHASHRKGQHLGPHLLRERQTPFAGHNDCSPLTQCEEASTKSGKWAQESDVFETRFGM